jgi:hypothetical protein
MHEMCFICLSIPSTNIRSDVAHHVLEQAYTRLRGCCLATCGLLTEYHASYDKRRSMCSAVVIIQLTDPELGHQISGEGYRGT